MTEYASHEEFADRKTPRDNWGIKDSRFQFWFINAMIVNETFRHCRIGKIKMKGKA